MRLANSNRVIGLGLVALTLLLQACAGDDEESSTPAEKCSAVMQKSCTYFVNCGKSTQAECEQAVRQTTHCDQAKAVSSTYDQCMKELDNWSCSVDDLPSSCDGAILH